MSTRRTIDFLGVLLINGALAITLSGCGGGAQETLPTGEVKIAPQVNPKPGVGPVSEEYKTPAPQ